MPELIERAGGRPLVTVPGQHAPTLTPEQLATLDPDVVLVKPCGFTLERTLGELDVLRRVLPWATWRAVAEARVYVADGNAFFNRPGPRIVGSRSRSWRPACTPASSTTSRARIARASYGSGAIGLALDERTGRETYCDFEPHSGQVKCSCETKHQGASHGQCTERTTDVIGFLHDTHAGGPCTSGAAGFAKPFGSSTPTNLNDYHSAVDRCPTSRQGSRTRRLRRRASSAAGRRSHRARGRSRPPRG